MAHNLAYTTPVEQHVLNFLLVISSLTVTSYRINKELSLFNLIFTTTFSIALVAVSLYYLYQLNNGFFNFQFLCSGIALFLFVSSFVILFTQFFKDSSFNTRILSSLGYLVFFILFFYAYIFLREKILHFFQIKSLSFTDVIESKIESDIEIGVLSILLILSALNQFLFSLNVDLKIILNLSIIRVIITISYILFLIKQRRFNLLCCEQKRLNYSTLSIILTLIFYLTNIFILHKNIDD